MPEHKRTGKKKVKRTVKWALAGALAVLAGLIIWVVVVPMVTAGAVTTYESYQVATGDISTQKSFSATLSVKKSETFSTSEASTVRALYVKSGQSVKAGDPLVLLSTGDLFAASFDGVVNEIRVEVGDWIWPNFQVVQVCDLEHLEVSMNVDEYDVESLTVGQSCTVRVISLGVDFDTVIAHINRVSQSQGSVAFYSVTCDLTVPENILPGMQATVTLPDKSVTGVTTVPMAALAFDEARKPYVLLKDAGGAYTRQYVETGLSDGMTVEVTSGLTPGQTVYAVSGTESVQAGFTLTDIYTFLFGKKTVVNDMSASGMGGNFQPPEGMPQFGDSTGQTATDGQTAADDQTATNGQAATGGQAVTDSQIAASGQTGADTTQTGTRTDTGAQAIDATGSATTGTPVGGQRPQQTGTNTQEATSDAQ